MDEFICQYCTQICKSKAGLSKHEKICKANPDAIKIRYSYKVCPKCGWEINTTAYNRHYNACTGVGPKGRVEQPPSKWKLTHAGLICQYCGKEWTNRSALCNHERFCKQNPCRDTSYFVEYNSTHDPILGIRVKLKRVIQACYKHLTLSKRLTEPTQN